jgi:organic radical activating enzyme
MYGYQIYLTHGCNLRCRQCGVWRNNKTIGKEKSLDEWLVMLPIMIETFKRAFHRKPVFKLMGGEPTIYPGFEDLCRAIKNLGCNISVLSNVSKTFQWELLTKVLGKGDSVFVSMDFFPDLKRQYEERENPAEEKAFAAYNFIRTFPDEQTDFVLGANITVSSDTLDKLSGLIDCLTQLNVKMNVCLRQGSEPGVDGLNHILRAPNRRGNLNREEVDRLVTIMLEDLIDSELFLGSLDYIKIIDLYGPHNNWHCRDQRFLPYVYLDSDGSLMACPDVTMLESRALPLSMSNPFPQVERMLKPIRRKCQGCTISSAMTDVVAALWEK